MNPVENEAVVAAAMIQYNQKYNHNNHKKNSNDNSDNKKSSSPDYRHRRKRPHVHPQPSPSPPIGSSDGHPPPPPDNNNDHGMMDTADGMMMMTYVELIDCPKFENVKLRNGISQWSVAEYQEDNDDDDGNDSDIGSDGNQNTKSYLQWYDTYGDAVRRVGHHDTTKNNPTTTVLTPTLWPPTDHADIRTSLRKCQRLLPHDQDSGGFFLALLRKCSAA